VRDLLRGCFALPAISSLPGLRRQTFYIDPVADPTFFTDRHIFPVPSTSALLPARGPAR
jgi:hypothetical protein